MIPSTIMGLAHTHRVVRKIYIAIVAWTSSQKEFCSDAEAGANVLESRFWEDLQKTITVISNYGRLHSRRQNLHLGILTD